MVLPSRLSRRFAIGISVIGGGMPRGFRATIFGTPTTGALPAAVFPLALVCAAAAPASRAGDAPSSDSKLRRLILISTPVDRVATIYYILHITTAKCDQVDWRGGLAIAALPRRALHPLIYRDARPVCQVSDLEKRIRLPARADKNNVVGLRPVGYLRVFGAVVPGFVRLLAAERPRVVEGINERGVAIVLRSACGAFPQPFHQFFFRVVALLDQAFYCERIADHQRVELAGKRAEDIADLVIEHRIFEHSGAASAVALANVLSGEEAHDVVLGFESFLYVIRLPEAVFFVFGDHDVVVVRVVALRAHVGVAGNSAVAQILADQRPGAADGGIRLRERTHGADRVIHVEPVADRPLDLHRIGERRGRAAQRGYSRRRDRQQNRKILRLASGHNGVDGDLPHVE